MWKKRILCLVLVLCAALVMTACKQKETFPTTPEAPEAQPEAEMQDQQNIFGETPLPDDEIDWDDGSHDPSEEEGGDEPAKGKKDDGSEQITLDMGGK